MRNDKQRRKTRFKLYELAQDGTLGKATSRAQLSQMLGYGKDEEEKGIIWVSTMITRGVINEKHIPDQNGDYRCVFSLGEKTMAKAVNNAPSLTTPGKLYRIIKRRCWWTSVFDTSSPQFLYWDEQLEKFEVGSIETCMRNGRYIFAADEVEQMALDYNLSDEFIIEEVKGIKVDA